MHPASWQAEGSIGPFFTDKCPTGNLSPTKSLPPQLTTQIKAGDCHLAVWGRAGPAGLTSAPPTPQAVGGENSCFLFLRENPSFLSLHQHTGLLRHSLSKGCPVKTPIAGWSLLLSSRTQNQRAEQTRQEVMSLWDMREYVKITLF